MADVTTEWGPGDEYPVTGMCFDSFNEYQDFTSTTDLTRTSLNPILGLSGEVGEIHEKLKKLTRPGREESIDLSALDDENKDGLAKELGDILWYVSRFAAKIGYSLGDIAKLNVDKLSDRKARGVIYGKGDTR
jgi:NTP pyrophosphatase (non-canonical NTP hydrolase)